MRRGREFRVKHWCRNCKCNCSVFFSKYGRIISKQSVHLFSKLRNDFGRTLLVRRRRTHANDMVSCPLEKMTSALKIVSVLSSQQRCTVSIFIFAVLLGFFRNFRYVLVSSIHDHNPRISSIAREGFYSNLYSATALVVSPNFSSSASSKVALATIFMTPASEQQSDQSKIIWKICEFSCKAAQQISLHRLIGPKWFVRCRQICWYDHGL